MPSESKSDEGESKSSHADLALVCESLTDFLLDDILPEDIYLGDEVDEDEDEEKVEQSPAVLFFEDVKQVRGGDGWAQLS